MKLTFYNINDCSIQDEISDIFWEDDETYYAHYGIRYETETKSDWAKNREIYEFCQANSVPYFLVRGAYGDSCHLRFFSDAERFEFMLKWF